MTEAETLSKIIAKRRTIKPDQYTGEVLDDAIIRKIVASANWAPTHGYTEPWRFTIFSGEGRASLGDFLATQDQPDTQADDFNQMRFDRLRNRPLKASHIIGIGMKRGNNPKVPEIEEICSVACAVQNMWLTAHTLGVAAYWSTGGMAFTEQTREFFGLGKGDRPLGFFYMGKSAVPHPEGRRLSEIEEKLKWVRS